LKFGAKESMVAQNRISGKKKEAWTREKSLKGNKPGGGES